MITADGNPDAYGMSSEMLGNAGGIFKSMQDGSYLQNINEYLNPYYEQVLNKALGRMGTNYEKTMGGIGDSAIAAGAFGGSRHGVAEGVATGEYNRNVGDVTAQLMSQGYGQAMDTMRGDMSTAASGMIGLGKDYYNIGNNIADRTAASGQAERTLWQQILDMGNQEYSNYMQNPFQMIELYSALLGNDVRRGNVSGTSTSTPGLFDYLSLGAQMGSAALGKPG